MRKSEVSGGTGSSVSCLGAEQQAKGGRCEEKWSLLHTNPKKNVELISSRQILVAGGK